MVKIPGKWEGAQPYPKEDRSGPENPGVQNVVVDPERVGPCRHVLLVAATFYM